MNYVLTGFGITAVSILSYIAWVLNRTRRLERAMVVDLRNEEP